MTCDESREHLSAFLDGELDVHRRRAVEEHLARCAACRAETQELEGVIDRVHESTNVCPEVLTSAVILARLPDLATRRAWTVARVVRHELVVGAIGTALVLAFAVLVGHTMPAFRAAALLLRLVLAVAIGGTFVSTSALVRWSVGGILLLVILNSLVMIGVRRLWSFRT